jgi:hypothetical protein
MSTEQSHQTFEVLPNSQRQRLSAETPKAFRDNNELGEGAK